MDMVFVILPQSKYYPDRERLRKESKVFKKMYIYIYFILFLLSQVMMEEMSFQVSLEGIKHSG